MVHLGCRQQTKVVEVKQARAAEGSGAATTEGLAERSEETPVVVEEGHIACQIRVYRISPPDSEVRRFGRPRRFVCRTDGMHHALAVLSRSTTGVDRMYERLVEAAEYRKNRADYQAVEASAVAVGSAQQ